MMIATSPIPYDDFHIFGLSHKTAPMAVLGKIALLPDEVEALYKVLSGYSEIIDSLVLSTCNRTEIYTRCIPDWDVDRAIGQALRKVSGEERFPAAKHIYRPTGYAGVEHLFRVSCGLDSMMVGETQILGQVKTAFDKSVARHKPSPVFDKILRSAFKVARSTRAQTEIGKGAVSLASASVHLSTRIFSTLHNKNVVVLGAGETGRLLVEHFAKLSPKSLTVANRTHSKAEALVEQYGIHSISWEQKQSLLADADVIACAVSTREPPLTKSIIEEAMKNRSGRPLALIDLGMPNNIESSCNRIANVFLSDIAALKRVVDGNLKSRVEHIPRVEELIKEEIERLLEWQRVSAAGPLISSLRDSVDIIRQREVNKACNGLSDKERQAVERATRAVTNKLLHGPITAIKDVLREHEQGTEKLDIIRKIFTSRP